MNVLITGAAGGLGRAFALECARRGYHLFLTDINLQKLEAIRDGLTRQYDIPVVLYPCNLMCSEKVDQMLQFFDDHQFNFDMLLNVAGIDFEGSFLQRGVDNILNIIQLNIEATLRITHAVLKRRTNESRLYIAFVSSLASLYPMPLKATYAASKRFLLDFSIALGQELESENVSVLSLCPGGLATTVEAQNGIVAQGFWKYATTNRLEKIANKTITRLLHGKITYIPGIVNWLFSLVSNIIPKSWLSKLLYKRWKCAQSKWLCNENEIIQEKI